MFKLTPLTFKRLLELQNNERQLDKIKFSQIENIRHKLLSEEIDQIITKTKTNIVDLLQWRPYLSNVITDQFKQMSLNKFYDPQFIQSLQLLFDVIIVASPAPNLAQTPSAWLYRRWLNNLRLISGDSVQANAFVVNYGQLSQAFVIKSPKILWSKEPFHEQYVAMMYTNILRSYYCPNFSYIYGSMYCTPPLIDPQFAELRGFSLHNIIDKSSLHLVYENIQPCISLKDYLILHIQNRNLDKMQFWSIVMQILSSLQLANRNDVDNRLQGFEHGDLHLDNILLRKIDKPSYIWYSHVRKFVKIDYVAVIIDYGMSKVKVSGKIYDLNDQNYIQPMSDVFKLIINILVHILMQSKTPEMAVYTQQWFNYLDPILKQFIDFDFTQLFQAFVAYQKLQDHVQGLDPHWPQIADWPTNSLDIFIDWLADKYRADLVGIYTDKHTDLPILTCSTTWGQNNCQNMFDYLNGMGVDWQQPWPYPRSLYELADQVGLSEFSNNRPHINFDNRLEPIHRQTVVQLLEQLKIIPLNIFYINSNTYQSELSINEWRNYQYQVMQFSSLYVELTEAILIALYLFKYVYPTETNLLSQYYQYWLYTRSVLDNSRTQLINSIQQNKVVIQSLPRSTEYLDLVYRRAQMLLDNSCLPVLTDSIRTIGQQQLLADLRVQFGK